MKANAHSTDAGKTTKSKGGAKGGDKKGKANAAAKAALKGV
jgi:hypothetical protein